MGTHIRGVMLIDRSSLPSSKDAIDAFPPTLIEMVQQHRPSRMPFFRHVRSLSLAAASDPDFLGDVHLIYQAAMHATRAAVYYLPYLDSPGLRKRKLQIFVDDDGLPQGDAHHYQLTRAFQNVGAKIKLSDEEFGSHEELCEHLDAESGYFVRLAKRLYSRSLGPWCAVEVLSVDWMRALAEAFAVHFPQFAHEPYFEDTFSHHVEERHARESLDVTQLVLRQHPELLRQTMRDAKMMAEALDGVWTNLDQVARAARRRSPFLICDDRQWFPSPADELTRGGVWQHLQAGVRARKGA